MFLKISFFAAVLTPELQDDERTDERQEGLIVQSFFLEVIIFVVAVVLTTTASVTHLCEVWAKRVFVCVSDCLMACFKRCICKTLWLLLL